MMKTKAAFMLLIFLSLSMAEDGANQAEDFISKTTEELTSEADSFVATGHATGVGTYQGLTSLISSFETGDCGASWAASDPVGVISTWLTPAVIAAIAVSFGVALVYMIGQLMNSPQLIAIAKDEGYQTAVTAVRILFIAVAIYAANFWYGFAHVPATDPVYAGADDMLDAAMAFSRLMLSDITKNYSALILFNMIVHTLYTATLWVGTNWRSMYNFNLGPVLKPFIDLIGIGTQSLSLAMGEWVAQGITLCFIKKWAWSFFIPAAILLRALPQTRDVGESIIMLVMALGTIYPFMFIVSYESHKLLSPYMADPMLQITEAASRTGIFELGGIALAMTLLGGGAIVPIVGGVIAVGVINLMESTIYYVVIMSLLLPFLNIFITLTLAREWAKCFNVNVNYLSFMKII